MLFLEILLDDFWILILFLDDFDRVWVVVFFNVSYFIKEKDCYIYVCLVRIYIDD